MKKNIILFCGALLLVGVSCQKKQQASFETDKVEMTDLKHLVVNDDSTFTGEVWNEDHRECIELKEGKKVKFTFTHANGNKAAVFRYANDGKEAESHFYDETGKEISKKEFGKQYKNLIIQYGNR